MTLKNPEYDEIDSTGTSERTMTKAEEQQMFREAIPIPTPKISDEEFEELKALKGKEVDRTIPESKNESILGLFAVPSDADITVSPYIYGGRLFFKKPDGLTYSGSAQFVGEDNILLTAAHCVRDDITGAFFSDFVFFRGYKNGSYEKKFDINAFGTKAGWVGGTAAKWGYDYAFLRASTSSDVGHLGYKTLENERSWTAFGYPNNYGNNQVMKKVNGTRGRVEGGSVESLGDPMRSGNSGGAWFIEVSANNRQALSNESFHINTTDEWGPVFTNATFTLLRAVRDYTG